MTQSVAPIPSFRIIFKIIKDIPENEQVIVKYCRQNGPYSIDEIDPVAVDYGFLDFSSPKKLFSSISKVGMFIVEHQLRNEPILPENAASCVMETTNLNDYIDKIVSIDYDEFISDLHKNEYIQKINLDL